MIEISIYKGVEAIILENGALRAIVLPSVGGKIASIYRKDKEFELLFQNKSSAYKKAKIYEAFEKYDASGFDDAFPTIDACLAEVGGGQVPYPDHGEIWSAEFIYKLVGKKAVLSYDSAILPYRYTKSVWLEGDSVKLEYSIKNTGREEFPCIWAMHCLMNCEKDMRLIFPEGTDRMLNVRQSQFLGEAGRLHTYPGTESVKGERLRLDRILPGNADNAEKYYAAGEVKEGICGAYYPSKDVTCKVLFDKEKLPYLGFWVTEGGFRGDYNCALEPTNGYYDSITTAQKEGRLYILKGGETLEFGLELELR